MTKTKHFFLLLITSILSAGFCWAQPAPQNDSQSASEQSAAVTFVMKLQDELGTGDMEGAIALFQEIPEELQNDIGLKGLLGALEYSSGDYTSAIKVANDILAVDKNNMEGLELLYKCYKAKKNRKAFTEIENKILSLDPYNPTVNIQKAEENVLYKKWKLARNYYDKALRGDDTNVDANFGYAKMSYYLNDIKTTKEYLNKVIELDPYFSDAYSYFGKLEYEEENYQEAVEYTIQAIKLYPDNYDYILDLGTYYSKMGKNEEALQAWTKATEIKPDYFLAYAYLAGLYDFIGNFDKALENYHKVIETNPKYYYAYESTAILEYHAEHYENAIYYFNKAYEYNDSYSYTLMIAACYFKLKKPLEAKKVLAAQMKKLNNKSTEYDLVRFFHDTYNRNAEQNLMRKIKAEDNRNTRCKMLFYMGLYNELYGSDVLAAEYYSQAVDIQAPMFFEYRLAEWGLKK